MQSFLNKSYLNDFTRHKQKWDTCTKCPLHEHATQHIFFRGKIPCDILFIGEGPGEHDEAMGMPMVANTGKLMDEIITEALPRELRWCITLSVCCRPVKAITKVELEACSDRLAEFISICKPTLLVYVGRQADSAGIKLLSRIEPIRSMVINHPGFILRKEEPDLEKKRVILQLKEAVKALYGSKTHHTNTPKTKLW